MIATRTIETSLRDIPEGRPIRFMLNGEGILVIRWGLEIKAWVDSCPHAGWRLSEGEMEGALIECPGHTWRFDVRSGQCIEVPAYKLIPVSVECHGETVSFLW